MIKDARIFQDLKDYVIKNFPQLEVSASPRYGFLQCDAFFRNGDNLERADNICKDVIKIMRSEGYDVYAEYTARAKVASINLKFPIVSRADSKSIPSEEEVQHILENNGYRIKSIQFYPGYAYFRGPWKDSTFKIDILY